ncbi:MAG: hypothetical protein F6J86_42650, partial [Symploca sp. SIO1B1]|nr:hypothetical protein [Symploca sp. SIO1B1]
LKELRSHLVCYNNNIYDPAQEARKSPYKLTYTDSLDLGSIPTKEGFQIHGNLQAFRLHDTYAADLTLYPDTNQEINIPQLQLFQPQSLLPTTIEASLGQTIWLYGEVDGTIDKCRELANKCAIALLTDTGFNPIFQYQDNFFGSLLFAFEAVNPQDSQDIQPPYQLLITLNYQQAQTIEQATQGYAWLIDLLCCYHKIRFIKSQASQRYRDARHLYSQLDQDIDKLSVLIATDHDYLRLENLKSELTKLPKSTINYNQCLGDLQTHHTALTTNTTNYDTCLSNLAIFGNIPKSWQDFLQQSRDRDLAQIQTDLNYLTPTQATFQQAVNAIRGTVEIEQIQSDRAREEAIQNRQQRLEVFITFVSTGLAVSGVSSQVADESAKTILCPSPSESPSFLCSSFTAIAFHIILGIIVAIPFAALVWRLQNKGIGNRE